MGHLFFFCFSCADLIRNAPTFRMKWIYSFCWSFWEITTVKLFLPLFMSCPRLVFDLDRKSDLYADDMLHRSFVLFIHWNTMSMSCIYLAWSSAWGNIMHYPLKLHSYRNHMSPLDLNIFAMTVCTTIVPFFVFPLEKWSFWRREECLGILLKAVMPEQVSWCKIQESLLDANPHDSF